MCVDGGSDNAMGAVLTMFADTGDAVMKSPPFLRGVGLVIVALVSLRVMYAIRRPEATRKTPFGDRAWSGHV